MSNDLLERRDVRTTGGFRLNLPAMLVSIAISRSAVRRVVTFRDSDAESSFLVALTEIVANAIDEHVRIGHGRPIVLDVRFGDHDSVRVVDSGDGYAGRATDPIDDPAGGGVPSARGRGVILARALVPELTFDASDSGTVVTLPLAGFGIVR